MEPPPLGHAARPFAWANFRIEAPDGYRLSQVEGRHGRGRLALADAERVRLELAWVAVTRRRFDAEAAVRRRLARALRGGGGQATRDAAEPGGAPPGLHPLRVAAEAEGRLDRFVGFCPLTRRLVEGAYHRGTAAEDRVFRRATLPTLRGQPPDAPAPWAFFGVSFIASAGFLYASSRLDLGDMRVSLAAGRTDRDGPSLTIRLVYPATLALARQPLDAWLEAWAQLFAPLYRPRRRGLWRGPIASLPVTKARGEGRAADLRLRPALRPVLWRTPRACRLWVIHDAAANRLLALQAADRPERLEGHLAGMLAGIGWAGTEG